MIFKNKVLPLEAYAWVGAIFAVALVIVIVLVIKLVQWIIIK
jgi:hypothetical protein